MTIDRERLTAEFDDALDVIDKALRRCPDDRWETSMWPVPRTDPWVWPAPGTEPVPQRTDESIQRFSAFWCVAYHALWFLDFYATVDSSGFESPEYVRGGPEELGFAADGAVAVPDRVWGREALVRYAVHGRDKVRRTLAEVTPEELAAACPSHHPWAGTTFERLVQVNLEHLREHGPQLARHAGTV